MLRDHTLPYLSKPSYWFPGGRKSQVSLVDQAAAFEKAVKQQQARVSFRSEYLKLFYMSRLPFIELVRRLNYYCIRETYLSKYE